jgi:hypothetical protein
VSLSLSKFRERGLIIFVYSYFFSRNINFEIVTAVEVLLGYNNIYCRRWVLTIRKITLPSTLKYVPPKPENTSARLHGLTTQEVTL